MLDYQNTMQVGQARYQDVLDALRAAGLPGVFTQTGGMCAALQVMLDSGHTLLVTDAEDTLSWDRQQQRGWGVGLYPPASEHDDGALVFHSVAAGSTAALLVLVGQVLDQWTGRLRH